MNREEYIMDERSTAAISAMDDYCKELETRFRDALCEAASEKAEVQIWKDECGRLNAEIEKLHREIERLEQFKKLHEMDHQHSAAMLRQLKGCDMCAREDCREKQLPVTNIQLCDDMQLTEEKTIPQSPAVKLPEGELPARQERLAWAIAQGSLDAEVDDPVQEQMMQTFMEDSEK